MNILYKVDLIYQNLFTGLITRRGEVLDYYTCQTLIKILLLRIKLVTFKIDQRAALCTLRQQTSFALFFFSPFLFTLPSEQSENRVQHMYEEHPIFTLLYNSERVQKDRGFNDSVTSNAWISLVHSGTHTQLTYKTTLYNLSY